ncbi:MAG: hypothetical protein N3G74_00275 [Candidatus Micrarchaeota archaeon]|nr:hypothetical protein [Candidatus Micrarchaeota archaeon]
MAADNISNNPSGKKEFVKPDVEEKRKLLEEKIRNEFKPKIELLKTGKEKVLKYAESKKEARINSLAAECQSQINEIAKKYSNIQKANVPKDEEIKQILKSVEALSLSEDEKKKVLDAINISFDEISAKKRAYECEEIKKKEMDETSAVKERYEAAKSEAEQWYTDFTSKYDSIFNDRIKSKEEQQEKLIGSIHSISEEHVDSMIKTISAGSVKEDTEDKKVEKEMEETPIASEPNRGSLKSDLLKLIGIISVPVIGIASAVFLSQIKSNPVIQQANNKNQANVEARVSSESVKVVRDKNSTVFINNAASDDVSKSTVTKEQDVSVSTNEVTIQFPYMTVVGEIRPLDQEKGESKYVGKDANEQNVKRIPPGKFTHVAKQIGTKSNSAKNPNNKQANIEKKQGAMPKQATELSLNAILDNLMKATDKIAYDGFPALKGSTKSHIRSYVKTIRAMDREGKLTKEQKKQLESLSSLMLKSLEIYIQTESRMQVGTQDPTKESKIIKKDIVKHIKWLRSQGFNEDAIKYLIKAFTKKLPEYRQF